MLLQNFKVQHFSDDIFAARRKQNNNTNDQLENYVEIKTQ